MAAYDEALVKIYEERLRNFYTKYDPSKLESVPALLTKYKGNEEKLLRAMITKYGPEPDPEELDSEDEEEEEEETVEEPMYCDVCGLPPEYCEYHADYEKCVPWLEKHCPRHLKEVAETKKSKRGGGVIKKKEVAEDKQRVVFYTEVRSRKKTVTVVEGLETLSVKLKDAAKVFGRKFACSSSVKDKDSGGQEIVIQGDTLFDLPDVLTGPDFSIPRAKLFTKDGGKLVPVR